ncbi:MAG TPA: M61 family peptidase [Candidatus Dormibacteraeota bacterium]|nr:M61 family peptidase [Candidatus Dormibacteraeota bacterium]
MIRRMTTALATAAFFVLAPHVAAAASGTPQLVPSLATASNPETLLLDAREAPRGIMIAHLHIPAQPGNFTVVYPKWIPGEHGPTGPIGDLDMLSVRVNGKKVEWRRDLVNLYAFHVQVPAGANAIDVTFREIENANGDTMGTSKIAIVNWNRDLLYQSDTNARDVIVKSSIILPAGWHYGSSMPRASRTGQQIDFKPVTLAFIVDTPLDMGQYAKKIVLWQQGSAKQVLDAFADHPEDLNFSPKLIKEYKRMTPQALALYGARHWYVYHSLLTLSNSIGFQGIEHHQSSDNRAPEDFMTNPMMQLAAGDLLTHEFSHSWNGKYRRPFDLYQPNFQIPERTELLWVYEGMNQYLGDLLSFRMGIRKASLYPEYLATVYARMDTERGRDYRPIIDLTTSAPYLYQSGGDYTSLRRTAGDFYSEGELMWLDVDTIIRKESHGTKSLDTFLHLYAGPPNTGPITVLYNREQIEGLLAKVVPYNWHAFFQKYVYSVAVHPPDAITRAGFTLVYNAKPNKFMQAGMALRHYVDAWYSLGITMGPTGAIGDVRRGSPAWTAMLSPHEKVVAIDGRAFSPKVLTRALVRAQKNKQPIALLIESNGYFNSVNVSYTGGPQYPHLVRIKGTTDMLAQIMARKK